MKEEPRSAVAAHEFELFKWDHWFLLWQQISLKFLLPCHLDRTESSAEYSFIIDNNFQHYFFKATMNSTSSHQLDPCLEVWDDGWVNGIRLCVDDGVRANEVCTIPHFTHVELRSTMLVVHRPLMQNINVWAPQIISIIGSTSIRCAATWVKCKRLDVHNGCFTRNQIHLCLTCVWWATFGLKTPICIVSISHAITVFLTPSSFN
jgi:hypothetical protein